MILYYLLLAHCLSLWYLTTFYWLPDYTYGTLLPSTSSLPIPLVLYHLLAHCLNLWYSTNFYWPTTFIYGLLLPSTGLSLWYFYWVPTFTYATLLPSLGPLHIPIVLHYLLLTHCLYLWYSSIFYWPLSIPMQLYYLLLDPCLYL